LQSFAGQYLSAVNQTTSEKVSRINFIVSTNTER
jgi:hypothetical protein